MEELAEKVDQVVTATTAAAAAQASAVAAAVAKGGWCGHRRGTARLQDGTLQEVDLTPDLTLGLGEDDRDKMAELLRLRGVEAATVEAPRSGPPYKDVLQWGETLGSAFMKAWVQRVDHLDFVREVCRCGEGLMACRQYSLAYHEVYRRQADRALKLEEQLAQTKGSVELVQRISACLRFYIGGGMCVYQHVIHRDPHARRRDTAHALRDVLRDLLVAVKLANNQSESVREELYWAIHNASLLAMRIARWLRMHGFAGLCVPPLTWLGESIRACLPFHAVHMLHFRTRFLRELVYCAESARKLGQAKAVSEEALKQLKAVEELEVKFPPVPEETTQAFVGMLSRFHVLRLKYDFWLGAIADATQLCAKLKEELPNNPAGLVSGLLEALQLQHGLPQNFGSPGGSSEANVDDLLETGDLPDPQAIRTKQLDLLAVILDELQVRMDLAETAACKLEEFTSKRLAFEQQEEQRARSEGTVRDGAEGGDKAEGGNPDETEVTLLTAPERPAPEQLENLGFTSASGTHTLEEVLPLAAHAMLTRECLRHEIAGQAGERLQGQFKRLERSLALRLRYRHFLYPPLVDLDVLISPERNRDNVMLPDGYEFLTGDLNALSLRNRQIESQEADGDEGEGDDSQVKVVAPTAEKPKGRHIYVIGRRFNAWESWTTSYPQPVTRLCDLRVVFSTKPPGAREVVNACGFSDPRKWEMDGKEMKLMLQPYLSGSAADCSGFDHADETERMREALLNQLVKDGHVKRKILALPIEAHPGAVAGAAPQHVASAPAKGTVAKEGPPIVEESIAGAAPYLVFSVYDEQSAWACDDDADRAAAKMLQEQRKFAEENPEAVGAASAAPPDPKTTKPDPKAKADPKSKGGKDQRPDSRLQPPELKAMEGVTNEALMPPWSPLLDSTGIATTSVIDFTIFVTKQMHAPVPSARFNAVIRSDLRQTPGELLGKPFQSYTFACAAVDAPSTAFVARELRVMGALRALHEALSSVPATTEVDGGIAEESPDSEGAMELAKRHRPELLDRLVEMAVCLERTVAGGCGQIFLLDGADFLEDVCTHVFLTHAWPRLRIIQETLQLHELKERMISDSARIELSEWSDVIRRLLPLLLRMLDRVQTVDALTLGSAAYALATLFLQENDSKSAQVELSLAIARLEREVTEVSTPGPEPELDRPVAAAISFDPPALRPPSFALYAGEAEKAGEGSDRQRPTLLLSGLSRTLNTGTSRVEQDCICLLTRLYEKWIESSLKVHLKNVSSTVRKARRPNDPPEEEGVRNLAGGHSSSSKISLSNQEASVLSRLGENPYLRCLFFAAVAKRRPDAAAAAVGKACQEVEAALAQERQLWEYCEHELSRQQEVLEKKASFAEVFRKPAGKKIRADAPLVVSRSPTALRFRLPPLPSSPSPATLASSEKLSPGKQDTQEQHSQKLNAFSAGSQPLTCALFGKASGNGSAVSDAHRELVGTGLRHQGYTVVEVTGLKPNSNYLFATMFYEGFEAARPAASLPSETSPSIGSYIPLPLALLRAELCKVVLRAGDSCKPLWSRAWGPLFELLCERTSAMEEHESIGLRSVKLRLDAVDRLPPVVLSAFAEVALLKNRGVSESEAFPTMRAMQQATLRSANESVLAMDCARRAGNSNLALQGVSLTLRLVRHLLQYRTTPPVLLSLLVKCASSLESFEAPRHQLPWFARARTTTTYLLHHIAAQSVQLRQLALLSKQLDGDVPERYVADELAEDVLKAEAKERVRDHTLELALLGGVRWPYAEGKARVALKDVGNTEELLAVLKDISERSYAKAAKDAAQLALRDDLAAGSFPLVLLRTAVARVWDREGLAELPLAEVLGRPPNDVLTRLLEERRQAFVNFGFILRALSPARLAASEAVSSAPEVAEVAAEQPPGQPMEPPAGATADAVESSGEVAQEPAPDDADRLAKHGDTQALAQLELLQAAPWLKNLCCLRFHRHDVSTFKFFDLQQIAVPDLSAEDARLGNTNLTDTLESTGALVAGATSRRGSLEGEEKQLEEWEVRENQDKKSREEAFELLQKCLRAFVRAATYASAAQADRLLQTVLASAFNALLIVGPSPAECVPEGPKENPEDAEPDGQVGSASPAGDEATIHPSDAPAANSSPPVEEGSAANVGNGLWADLGLLAELAVSMLLRLRDASSPQAAAAAAARAAAVANQTAAPRGRVQTGEEGAEAREVRLAGEAQRACEAAEEESNDVWFERTPDLDVTSLGKLVAFAVLCLYHMRRWNSVILLCRTFNDATCSVFATTFLPLMIGAQKEICSLSSRSLGNTERYLKEAKATFEIEQKKLPRKVQRQLMLSGERSEPEKLFRKQSEYYEDMLQRQRKLNNAWEGLLKSLESVRNLNARAVPAATKQLRESRLLLANYLQERQDFEVEMERGKLTEVEKKTRKRALGLASSLLISSYRKSVELLRKRQMSDLVVQALHELGNLQWLEGDVLGAQGSWSDAVDTAYQFVYAVKNWQKCVETAVRPPKDVARAEIMLLTTAILAKYARLTVPRDVTVHVHAALFASGIVEAVVTSSLPHPSQRILFSSDRYRLREICFGLREARALMTPNSLQGLDGLTFLNSLAFFHDTLMALDYQPVRCLPICAIHNYVATDVCRNQRLAVKGRLMTARSLLRCRSLTSAWLALYTLARGHDMPQPLLAAEALDRAVVEVQDLEGAGLTPYNSSEEPFTEANMQAMGKVTDPSLLAEGSDIAEAMGSINLATFRFLQAELLVCVCSYGFVCSRNSDPEGKVKATTAKWLESADALLCNLWKSLVENDDCSPQESSEITVNPPSRTLTEEESELCVEIRLLRAKTWELRGDLGRAAREVLAGMGFVRLLAETGVKSSQDCRIGGEASAGLRTHPGTKSWMMLRRRIVQLLVAQGRLKAADAHITQGLQESQSAHDEVTRVELLSAKVRVDILNGRLMELRGDRRLGALPIAENCLTICSRNLPQPTIGAIHARLMLFLLLQQNPSLASHLTASETPDFSAVSVAAAGGASEDPNEEMVLEAQGRIVLSPMAQALVQESMALGGAAPSGDKRQQDPAQLVQAAVAAYRMRQFKLVGMVEQCIRDLDAQLEDLGFQLRPHNMNGLLNFSDDIEAQSDAEPPKRRPMLPTLKLPALKLSFRDRPCPELPVSDSREPPNVYLELMPLRLHCELRLAQLQLDLGELSVVEGLLRDAEERMARCVHLLPWLYVQYCILKLRWRRLSIETGVAHEPPPPLAPNHDLYRDPQAFATGVCPPSDSPLFRTFLQRAGVPSLTEAAEWVPGGRAATAEEGLQEYLQQLCAVTQIATLEGGHDYSQVSALLREGMEEVLRVKGQESPEAMSSAVYPFFCCLVAVAEARKALYFEPSPGYVPEDAQVPADSKAGAKGGAAKPAKGAAQGVPAPLDVAALPRRIALDIYGHLKRQGPNEGALAYSAAALQEAQKSIALPTLVRHSMALRRECNLFSSLFHAERLLSDQLHTALSQVSDAYLTAKVLGEPQLRTIEMPSEPPSAGDMLVHWTWPDYDASTRPPDELCAFLLFVCPLAEDPPVSDALVARRGDVNAAGLRRLWDALSSDADHVKPAASVTTQHVSQRLLAVANLLRGRDAELEAVPGSPTTCSPTSASSPTAALRRSSRLSASQTGDFELQAAMQRLLLSMSSQEASATDTGDGSPRSVPQLLDAQKVQAVFQALVRLLDRGSSTARISHPELSRFLRTVLGPLRLPKS